MTLATLRLSALLVLDWFDGPIEALALAPDGGSYSVRHVGEPPITRASVFEVLRLKTGSFEHARDTAVEAYGAARAPIWVLPPAPPENDDRLRQLLSDALRPVGALVGYCQTSALLDRDLGILWVNEERATALRQLAGDELWQAALLADADAEAKP